MAAETRYGPAAFRAALLGVPARERDAWLDRVLELREIPNDGPELPRGCVPYLPCPVDAILRLVDQAAIDDADVFVDVGSGLGRAAACVHLLTGATAIGIEIQPALVRAARDRAARLELHRVSYLEGDAALSLGTAASGTVFFLYCPFSGERLTRVLGELEAIARTRVLRVACLDLPLPACSWLELAAAPADDLVVYRSTLLSAPR